MAKAWCKENFKKDIMGASMLNFSHEIDGYIFNYDLDKIYFYNQFGVKVEKIYRVVISIPLWYIRRLVIDKACVDQFFHKLDKYVKKGKNRFFFTKFTSLKHKTVYNLVLEKEDN